MKKIRFCPFILFLFGFIASTQITDAQTPNYELYITNEVQLSSKVYQFDVYLLRGNTPMELAGMQFGIGFDTSIVNGGNLNFGMVSGSSQLNAIQTPLTFMVGGSTQTQTINGVVYRFVSQAMRASPGGGNGTVISNVKNGCNAPGTRIGTYRLTNSTNFKPYATAKHVFSTSSGSGITNTIVTAYVNGVNTTQTGNLMGYQSAGTCSQNIVLNDCSATASTGSVTACDSYTWNGVTYTTSGVKTWIGINALGCDSVATLNLTILSQTASSENAIACSSYTWHGVTYTTSGLKTWTGTNAAGCDSVVSLNLRIASNASTQTVTACNSYTWHGVTYTASGVKSWTGINAAGCDSVVTLNLTVVEPVVTSFSVTACESYSWDGILYTTSGNYTKTYQSYSGCDSVVTLNLTIHTINANFIVADTINYLGSSYLLNIGSGFDSYLWNTGNSAQSINITSSGWYRCMVSKGACIKSDSVYVNLRDYELYITNEVQLSSKVYQFDVYLLRGNTPMELAGMQFGIGFDTSIVNGGNLNFGMVPGTSQLNASQTPLTFMVGGPTQTQTINGVVYRFASQAMRASPGIGNGTVISNVKNGCNAPGTRIGTYRLTNSTNFKPYATAKHVFSTSSGSGITNTIVTAYVNGVNTTQNGNLMGYQSVGNCNQNILFKKCIPSTSTESVTACDSYTWNGVTYTTSGLKTWIGTNADQCDSTVKLFLTINNGTHNSEYQTACETYIWHGSIFTESGTYTYSYINESNCPSVDTLHLTVHHGTHKNLNQTVCENYLWNGTIYTESGIYTYGYLNEFNCTSVDTLNLTVNYGTHNSEYQTACEYYEWHGTIYTSSGTYTYNYINESNCSSSDTLNLTVNYGTHNIEYQTACENYLWNGTIYTESGIYTYGYLNEFNCISVDTLNLTVNFGTHNSEHQTACEYYEWHGIVYRSSGTYTYNYFNESNCSSTDTLYLIIHYGTHNMEHQIVCENYNWHGIIYTTSGTYTYSYVNESNCPSVDSLYLTISQCNILNVKCMLEGYYTGNSQMVSTLYNLGLSNNNQETDTVEISLWSPDHLNNSAPDYVQKTILNKNGNTYVRFPPELFEGNYYISVKHRNSLETWSALPVNVQDSIIFYDFTSGLDKAYVDGVYGTMKNMGGGVYAFYSGNVDQDATIDINDMSATENDAFNFAFGYNATDCNGDGASDALDMQLIENNAMLQIYTARPY